LTPEALRAAFAPFFPAVEPEARLGMLIEGLYRRQGPMAEARLRLASAAALIPRDLIPLVALSQGSAPDPDVILALNAAFAFPIPGQEWLHFQLAMQLRAALRQGQADARWPALAHAAFSLERGQITEVARAEMRGLIAELSAQDLPDEALRNALEAIALGRVEQQRSAEAAIAAHAADVREGLMLTHELALPHAGPGAGVTQRLFDAGGEVALRPPQGDAQHYIFAHPVLRRPPIHVLEVEDAVLSYDISRPGQTEFYVFNQRRELLHSVSRGDAPFIARPPSRVEETLAFADDRFSEINVSHILLDKLPRAGIYEATAREPHRLLLLRAGPYYDQVLGRAGLTAPFVPEGSRGSLRIRRLLASTNVARDFQHPAQFGAPWAIDYLRRVLRPPASGGQRRIYISRQDSHVRRVLNEAALAPVLSEYGFETVELSRLSLDAQAALFGEASHVAGVHGAGLTNLLFARPGTKVLEILPPLCAAVSYWVLAGALDQPYWALVAEDPEGVRPDYADWAHDPELNMRDVRVDPMRLGAGLEALTRD
jgi:hypothetical protein